MTNRDYEGKKVSIWLAYFVASSRSKGRRYSKKIKVNVTDIINASRELGLNPEYLEKVHPASKIKGVIIVDKLGSKSQTIKKIMEYIQSQPKK
ncbi:MAG: SEC65, signal recognition particle 19 kDa protein [Candidatus Aramenus sulfurataquae]|jgi:signal recognition particle subunit SRP19|uniref:SEC65, signal recognition particle 19 kDa protein n=2 Tax=Candidatus Aramenus sulfurataquae TaxID=1326980 RepID=W7L6Y2_9CREN|nr:MAG: SEC65, signal recognition particle 19 kDa protein [Candidatus Aramenus sulfurataquae]MCL7343215.1 hypothetical protein [Candidatus Aramenus sulfurataquae]